MSQQDNFPFDFTDNQSHGELGPMSRYLAFLVDERAARLRSRGMPSSSAQPQQQGSFSQQSRQAETSTDTTQPARPRSFKANSGTRGGIWGMSYSYFFGVLATVLFVLWVANLELQTQVNNIRLVTELRALSESMKTVLRQPRQTQMTCRFI